MEILRSKKNLSKKSIIFIENCMEMKNFEIENFRKFSIPKISKMFIENCMKMKNLEIKKIENFRSQKFSDVNFQMR